MGLVCFKLRSLEIRYPESLVTPEILATWFSSQVLFPSLFSLFQAQLFWLQEVQTFLSLQPLSQILSSSQDTFCYLPSSLEQISMFWKPNSPVVVKWYFSPELSSVLDQLRLQLFMFCDVLRSKAGKHKNVCWVLFYGSEEAFHSFVSCSGLKKNKPPVLAYSVQMLTEQMVREYFLFSLSMCTHAVQRKRPWSRLGLWPFLQYTCWMIAHFLFSCQTLGVFPSLR